MHTSDKQPKKADGTCSNSGKAQANLALAHSPVPDNMHALGHSRVTPRGNCDAVVVGAEVLAVACAFSDS